MRGLNAGRHGNRTFPLVEAASGNIDGAIYVEIWTLMSEPGLWQDLILATDRNTEMRGYCHRVLLSLVCQLARTLAHHRQCHHVAICGVLRGPEHAKASERKPRCLLDPWALRLVRFDADKVVLSGETIAAILETAASLIKLDIAGIEALHDSTRRRLLTRHRPAGIEAFGKKICKLKPKTTTLYSPVKAPETQKIVCLFWIRMLNKAQIQWIL